jgi:surface polysaccharide O-acyltransferase-like enzyme
MEKPTSRLLFADWLRAWALLVMIETHVFNAFLTAQLRDSQWFRNLNFLNGLVAPSFLFVSGFVFLLSRKPLSKQLPRIGMVWLIAYALHLPRFDRVDILHCIAFTWLFLLVSLVAIRGAGLRIAVWTACTLALTGLAPLVWSVDFRTILPLPVAAYLNDKTQSLFPLFPWSGFMLAGAVCASWFLAARGSGREKQFMTGLAAAGAVMVVLSRLLPPLGFQTKAWVADPRTFLLRLGIVLLALAACWVYALYRAPRKSLLLDVSRESLFVYVAHLLVIYGPIWMGHSLADIVGMTQGPLMCALGSVALAALMVGTARGWGAVKRRRSLPR